MFVMMLISVSAKDYRIEIKEKALELKTLNSIDLWVEDHINYSFYYHARNIKDTWKEKRGDCTDKAILKCVMLTYNKIGCRKVHGYVTIDNKKVKHDWIEWQENKTWVSNEYMYYKKVERRGLGIW